MYDSRTGLRRGDISLGFVIGLLVGAVAAGGTLWVVLERKRTAAELAREEAFDAQAQAAEALKNAKIRQEDLAAIQGMFPGADLVKKPAKEIKTKDDKVLTEEEVKVHDLCQGFIEDVEARRLLAAYRVTSKSYQTKTPRMKFDEMIEKVKLIRSFQQLSVTRGFRIRPSPGGKGYDFGYTIAGGNVGSVSFVLVVSKGEGDEWRIDDVEITQTGK